MIYWHTNTKDRETNVDMMSDIGPTNVTDRQTDIIAVNTMYLNENKYTEKRVARSHNVLRLKSKFVDADCETTHRH